MRPFCPARPGYPAPRAWRVESVATRLPGIQHLASGVAGGSALRSSVPHLVTTLAILTCCSGEDHQPLHWPMTHAIPRPRGLGCASVGEVTGRSPSMQEMMRRRRRSGFVGRLAEVDYFRSNLRLPPDDEQRRFLFTVHGDAGVGKTSLVRHLISIAQEQGALCAYVDHPVVDILSAMDTMAAEFARSGCPMTTFVERSATYRRRRRELETDPDAPTGSGRALASLALRIGLRAAGDVPVVGSVVGAVADEIDPDAVLDQTERLRAFIGSKLRGHDDVQLLLAPVDVLTSSFVANFQLLAGHQPVALFFDTYERTAPVLDGWLRELVGGAHGELPANLTITVAGQYGLDANAW